MLEDIDPRWHGVSRVPLLHTTMDEMASPIGFGGEALPAMYTPEGSVPCVHTFMFKKSITRQTNLRTHFAPVNNFATRFVGRLF